MSTWTLIADELPPEGVDVLVRTARGTFEVMSLSVVETLDGGTEAEWYSDGDYMDGAPPWAWMAIPPLDVERPSFDAQRSDDDEPPGEDEPARQAQASGASSPGRWPYREEPVPPPHQDERNADAGQAARLGLPVTIYLFGGSEE